MRYADRRAGVYVYAGVYACVRACMRAGSEWVSLRMCRRPAGMGGMGGDGREVAGKV